MYFILFSYFEKVHALKHYLESFQKTRQEKDAKWRMSSGRDETVINKLEKVVNGW